jgi:DNA gyrase/topoisomerase IV subunit A
MAKKKGSTLKPLGKDRNITQEALHEVGTRNFRVYSTEFNLERAFPDLVDGLKPVQRRILWVLSQYPRGSKTKTAQVSGDVTGRFHPHAPQAVDGAMTGLVHDYSPTMIGHGEWGSLIDPAAASRYTNVSLSEFGATFFDPNYINKEVTSFIPAYTDKEDEPVTLPAPLPFILMTGAEGTGVALTTALPSFTPESLVEVMTRMLDGEELEAKDFAKTLKYAHKWGGEVVNTKENRKAWMQMFTSSEAKVQFRCKLDVLRDDKLILISDWAPDMKPETFVEKVRSLDLCAGVDNIRGLEYQIRARKDCNFNQFDKLVEQVEKIATVSRSFKINVTYTRAKVKDGVVKHKTKLLAFSVPELITTWLKERIAMELRSLAYRVKKQQEAIAYSKLLIFAVDKLDVIFKALRTDDPDAYLIKHLKLTKEQAKQILDLQVRKLSKLDQKALRKKLKEQEDFLKQLQKWEKNPKKKVKADFQPVLAAIQADRARATKQANRKLNVRASS